MTLLSAPDLPLPDWGVVAVFAIVYLGMFLGGLPRLKLDRSGVALLGAIAMIALTGMPLQEAARAVDLPTLVLLFAFMVVSAQMRLGGFYAEVTRAVGRMPLAREGLLAVLIAVAAALSAVFSNDVICLAMTPVVARICLERRLDPLPCLVGLACAANIGSAATLIGNPQNMLIGSLLDLPFAGYVRAALVPVVLSLVALWAWLAFGPGARRARSAAAAGPAPPAGAAVVPTLPTVASAADADSPAFDRWQTAKGLAVAATLMLVFLFTGWPREVAALVGAGVLLLSRRLHSAQVMGYVDWPLLLLFIGLFVVNHAFQGTGLAAQAVAWLAAQGVHLHEPGALLVLGVALSNLVSNVPAVMLLLPHLGEAGSAAAHDAGVLLALASTFAGNLLLVGSIANLIVVDLAEKAGLRIDWAAHARIGVPVTLISLAILWGWLAPMA
ncbi:MAG: anion transporter [Burkholderiales bacterium]|nr:anion transporter [Burkholderiales bacterium]